MRLAGGLPLAPRPAFRSRHDDAPLLLGPAPPPGAARFACAACRCCCSCCCLGWACGCGGVGKGVCSLSWSSSCHASSSSSWSSMPSSACSSRSLARSASSLSICAALRSGALGGSPWLLHARTLRLDGDKCGAQGCGGAVAGGRSTSGCAGQARGGATCACAAAPREPAAAAPALHGCMALKLCVQGGAAVHATQDDPHAMPRPGPR